MSTNFPTDLDTLSNPTGSDAQYNTNPAILHSVQHTDANDAIEALQRKVGIDGSEDVDSLDYKVAAFQDSTSHARYDTVVTTSSLAAEASDAAKTAPLGKGCIAIIIITDYPAWVRVYSNTDAQTADASRPITTDPVSGTGVLLEVVTAAGALEIILSPTAVLVSSDGSINLPVTITNKDSVTRTITVTITTVPVEG
jgi:hypothetical protein